MMMQTKSAKKLIALILCFPVLLSLSLTACKKDTHDLYEHTKSTEEDTEFYSIIDPIFVSDDEMIPTSVTTPIMNKTMPDNTMPVTVASVNLKKSFIVHIVFMPALLKLTKINN